MEKRAWAHMGDVLLIEADLFLSSSTNQVLTKHGYSVTTARSQIEINEALDFSKFDVVLTSEKPFGTTFRDILPTSHLVNTPVVLLKPDVDEQSLIKDIRKAFRNRTSTVALVPDHTEMPFIEIVNADNSLPDKPEK